MKKDKSHRLRMLLKAQELSAPSTGFTDEVMKEITTPIDLAASGEDVLQNVLRSASLPQPTAAFTFKVLRGIREPAPQPSLKPVIGRTGWSAIVLFVVVCIVVAFMPPDSSADVLRGYDSWIASKVQPATKFLQDFIPYGTVVVIVIVVLLTLDRRLRKVVG